MRRVLLFSIVALVASASAMAQTVDLRVTKSGQDVVLTWTGGTGPFKAYKSRRPKMTGRRIIIANPATSPVTDVGAVVDGVRIWFYQVSQPGVTITVTTPTPNFDSPTPCVSASGTAPGAVAVYVNEQAATVDGSGNWSIDSAPLAIVSDPLQAARAPVTVAAVDANGDWTVVVVDGTYGGNIATEKHPCVPRVFGR